MLRPGERVIFLIILRGLESRLISSIQGSLPLTRYSLALFESTKMDSNTDRTRNMADALSGEQISSTTLYVVTY